ncbi:MULTISPECIES: hypothetical protein [Actinomycetes]|uniref:Uncharacterized protein n=1 Tax=Microbacterium aurantiacum TaxID=162393 RepID=A0AAJ2HGC0_9MICO|nr:hypothetical protein [Microbacterium aurantiacum]MDS0246990.1 hypothetical protein [Microbacterium aurantiacum]
MATDYRRPRGTRVDPVAIGWEIERSRKDRFIQLAHHAGVSSAAFLEIIMDRLEDDLTDRGVPSWWPEPSRQDGELPIEAA